MGKRSRFERIPRDKYNTPREAILPLLPHLKPVTVFVEPCANDGKFAELMDGFGHFCAYMSDIEPTAWHVGQVDAFNCEWPDLVITNPPWDRKILHPMIDLFRQGEGCWLLFDADWMHTRQSVPYMRYCHKIVSVGRVKWIEGSKMTGKENCAWYFFGPTPNNGGPIFYGRV